MTPARLTHACVLALTALAIAGPATAHGLRISATGERNGIVGRVSYSDGQPGAGEFVELRDLTTSPPQSRSSVADASGTFRFPAEEGHRYALIAHGEEGHSTEMRLTLSPGARSETAEAPSSDAGTGEQGRFRALLIIAALLAIFALAAGGRQILGHRRSRAPKSG